MRNVFHSVRVPKGEVGQSAANVVGGLQEMYYTDTKITLVKRASLASTISSKSS